MWVVSVLRSFIVSFLALTVSLWLLPGVQITRGTESVETLAIVVLTVLIGTVGLLIAGLLAQVLILGIVLNPVSVVEPLSVAAIFVASWGAAGVN